MTETASSSPALAGQIESQPQELDRVLRDPIAEEIVRRLRPTRRLWLVGTGTSQHAAELGAAMLRETGRAAHAASSMQHVTWGAPLEDGDGVVVISHNAGTETAYAGAAWTRATEAGLPVVAVTRIGGAMPDAIETVTKETSHTYTVSYTTALVRLAQLAHALGAEAFGPQALAPVPEAVAHAIAAPGTDDVPLPERLLVLAGEGPAGVTAREGALKVREASRFPCEGYDVEYLLHGHAVPLGDRDRLVLLEPPDTDGLVDGVAAAAEAEGVPVSRVLDPAPLPPLLAQIPLVVRLQLLALRAAVERGFDPDLAIERAWADEGLWAIGSPASRPASAG